MQRPLVAGLKRAGYAVDTILDGAEGLWLAQSNHYSVLILNLAGSDLSELSMLHRLRQRGKSTPCFVLTPSASVDERVQALQAGAADCLGQPFEMAELLARLDSIGRRGPGAELACVSIGDLRVNLQARIVERGGSTVSLSPREFALIEFFVHRRGQVVSRAEIEEHLYGHDRDPMSNVVDSAVCALRRKLTVRGSPSLIETRRGMGYILVTRSAATSAEGYSV